MRFLALLLFAPVVAFAATADGKKAELQELQQRIEALRQDLAKSEESRTHAGDQLRATESAISDANRKLRELAGERGEVQGELAGLEAQGQRLDRQIAAQQNQLARLLNRQFVGGESDALKLLLAGRDPNLSARDQYFLTQLSRAEAELIRQLKAAAVEKQRLAEAARDKQAQLAEIQRRQQEGRAQLVVQQKERQATLAKLADRILAQRKEIDSARRDEQRLAQLIEGLAKIAAQRQAARTRAKVGAGGTAKVEKPTPGGPTDATGDFARLRGKLKLPVKGQVTGRFGAARSGGGATWKGLFIKAAEGLDVRAVATGTVVFSDWMRGFGNLLIVDHGDDFLSIYGNNQSLLAGVGAAVRGGEPVATVGNSGGNPESGLYFELRHRGQPFDPQKWAGR